MDMKTFKLLEFAAIFGVLGYFWWSQRQSRLRYEEEKRKKSEAESSSSGSSSTDEPS
jgi:cytoskeletal protein RodZ